MPSVTELEDIRLLRTRADSVTNGHRGDLTAMSDLLGSIGHSVAAIREAGIVTAAQCEARHPTPPPEPVTGPWWRGVVGTLATRSGWALCALVGWLAWLYCAYRMTPDDVVRVVGGTP